MVFYIGEEASDEGRADCDQFELKHCGIFVLRAVDADTRGGALGLEHATRIGRWVGEQLLSCEAELLFRKFNEKSTTGPAPLSCAIALRIRVAGSAKVKWRTPIRGRHNSTILVDRVGVYHARTIYVRACLGVRGGTGEQKNDYSNADHDEPRGQISDIRYHANAHHASSKLGSVDIHLEARFVAARCQLAA